MCFSLFLAVEMVVVVFLVEFDGVFTLQVGKVNPNLFSSFGQPV
jgi:hypothetical protein